MKKPRPFLLVALIAFTCLEVLAAQLVADPPHVCEYCEGWARPREPFHVFGNTWYVGGGVSSVLITSKQGHVLIDGGLTQTAPQIAASIARLGFRLEDVKLIVNSHTHYDHAGRGESCGEAGPGSRRPDAGRPAIRLRSQTQ